MHGVDTSSIIRDIQYGDSSLGEIWMDVIASGAKIVPDNVLQGHWEMLYKNNKWMGFIFKKNVIFLSQYKRARVIVLGMDERWKPGEDFLGKKKRCRSLSEFK